MTSTSLSPIATRFAWKEYRTLRSFWLAAFIIPALLQAVTIALAPRSADPVTSVFAIALAAAALYAVGVAATTFSMEHEEETYTYLTGLPTRWLPLFAGKCSFAAVSSFLLAAALLTSAWLFAGSRAPSGAMTSQLFATFGFGIVEMLAWGVFYSLLIRQPLLAALLAIGTESLAVTWTASVFGPPSNAVLTMASYADVLLPRIAIAAVVLAVDVLLARRWLVHEHQGHAAETIAPAASTAVLSTFTQLFRAIWSGIMALARHYSPRVFGRLAWQAWRQSWKPMLSMMLIVPGLSVVLILIAGIWNVSDRIRSRDTVLFPYFVALVAMAIYWSVVFYADQRQHKYRFLAEHAVWPRYVWLSRLFVWSLPFILLAILAAFGSITVTFNFIGYMRHRFNDMARYDLGWDTQTLAYQWRELDVVSRSFAFGLWGACLGAALGQATSLFFRRALVAGFAAIVFALPLAVWGFAAWSWELRPIIFLAPLALGLIAATWLRVPDWLVDRNSLTSWAKVAAALVAPLAFIAWQLPAARTITQVEQYEALASLDGKIDVPPYQEFATAPPIHADQIVARWAEKSAATIPIDNQITVDRLVRLGEMIEYPPRPDDWFEQEGMEIVGHVSDEYVESMISKNEQLLQEAVPLALSDYRLSVSEGGLDRIQGLQHLLNDAGAMATRDGKLDDALDFHLAALTLWERLWTGQSTNTFQSGQDRPRVQEPLVDWAHAKGQTGERIKRAITALDKIYPPVTERQSAPDTIASISDWIPPHQILATHQQLQEIIFGEEPSRLIGKEANVDNYVAVMSNELPLERARALTILDFFTITQVVHWRDVIWRVNQQLLQEWSKQKLLKRDEYKSEDLGSDLRNKIQAANANGYFNRYDARWLPDEPPYTWLRTSPFLRREMEKNRSFGDWLASVVNTEIAAWGLRQQLALLAFKADHGKYPEFLVDLVPEYLPFVPIDPYSGRQFEYRPHGLSLDLQFRNYPYEWIPANTPLLWSVGANGQQPELTFFTEGGELSDPYGGEGESRSVRREIYQFSGNVNWHDPLIFLLPNSPKSRADEDSKPAELAPTDPSRIKEP